MAFPPQQNFSVALTSSGGPHVVAHVLLEHGGFEFVIMFAACLLIIHAFVTGGVLLFDG